MAGARGTVRPIQARVAESLLPPPSRPRPGLCCLCRRLPRRLVQSDYLEQA